MIRSRMRTPSAPSGCSTSGKLVEPGSARNPARRASNARFMLETRNSKPGAQRRARSQGKPMLKNYLKIAFKVFLRRKFFTFISLFAISFTLVVLMVAVAFLDHIFGKQSPENKQERTLGVYSLLMTGPNGRWGSSGGYRFFDRHTRNLPGVEKMSLLTETERVYSYKDGEKIESYIKRTDGVFWEILEFNFLEGGPYTNDDEKNENYVAVINEATRRKFFGDELALGKTIDVDGQRFREIGRASCRER